MSRRRGQNPAPTATGRHSGGWVSLFVLAVVVGGLAVLVALFLPHITRSEAADSHVPTEGQNGSGVAKPGEETDVVSSEKSESELGFQSNLSSIDLPVAHVEEPGGSGQADEVLDTSGEGGAPEGFSDMDSMLHWAIGHSDPEKLGTAAKAAKRMSTEELQKRSKELKELMDAVHMPSDAELMKIALADLRNATSALPDRRRALHELLELVVSIDNAVDLDKLGGLETVLRELQRPEAELRTLAAWVLGQAAQNNPTVQLRLLEVGALPQLIEMVRVKFGGGEEGKEGEESVKALYAIAAVVRNQPKVQEAFFGDGGGSALIHEVLFDESRSIMLRRKVVALVGDLAEQQSGHELSRGFFLNKKLLDSLLGLTLNSDLDIREKSLLALQSVAGTGEMAVEMLVNECLAASYLEKLARDLRLDHWKVADQLEFVQDLAKLCEETMKRLFPPRSSRGTALG